MSTVIATTSTVSVMDDDSRKRSRSRSTSSDDRSSLPPSSLSMSGNDGLTISTKKTRLTLEATRDQAIDAVAEIHLIIAKQRSEIDQLRSVVNQQQEHINFLLSVIGMTDATSPPITVPSTSAPGYLDQDSSSAVCPPAVDSVAPAAPTYTMKTANLLPAMQPLAKRFTSAVVSAVYRDLDDKDRRSRNVVVSGLPAGDDDKLSVTRLLTTEFNDPPNVVKVRRLGREHPGKLRPLLVVLANAGQASSYVRRAKQLRQSSDEYVKRFIYVNADATRAEALAAYQIRCERRERATRSAAARSSQQQSSAAASAMTAVLLPTADEFHPVASQNASVVTAATAMAFVVPSASSRSATGSGSE